MADPTPTPGASCPACSAREMMAIAAGRFIKDGDVLFAGTGVAMLAAAVAKRITPRTRTSSSRPAASGRRSTSCRWRWPTPA